MTRPSPVFGLLGFAALALICYTVLVALGHDASALLALAFAGVTGGAGVAVPAHAKADPPAAAEPAISSAAAVDVGPAVPPFQS
ncbi:MAG: hypothetical protein JWO67_8 [Streptosporangiaceae bacterium]|nr:hypothetical protein [Streptosporangiaceae bacterium]